jgi:hypothetical protein
VAFNFQPALNGQLTTIRAMRRSIFDTLSMIASDPDLWAQHPVPELARADVFTANLEVALGDEGGLTVLDRATGLVIGY